MKVRFHVTAFLPVLLAAGPQSPAPGSPEPPTKTTVCALLADPAPFNHKLVQVTGFASHGFEDSGFSSPECESRFTGLWMEFGGTHATGTMSTVSTLTRTRPEAPVIEGIAVPLVEDAPFRHLDHLLHVQSRDGSLVHATVIARFFAGRQIPYRGNRWGGFGHMGCCSLFFVQQVLSVDETRDPTLDPGDTPDQPHWKSVQFLNFPAPQSAMLAAQREAEAGARAYAFTDSDRVALEALLHYSKTTGPANIHLHPLASTPARATFEATVDRSRTRYRLVLSRPAWLSFYAADPHRVSWVVLAAFSTEG